MPSLMTVFSRLIDCGKSPLVGEKGKDVVGGGGRGNDITPQPRSNAFDVCFVGLPKPFKALLMPASSSSQAKAIYGWPGGGGVGF